MVNITHKQNSLRKAIASAMVKVSKQETIDAIKQRKVPKGDVFEFARAAGLLGIKKTSDVIPDCHPLPVEYASITYEIHELSVKILVEVHTIYKTGVEVEAMHGAAVTALVMYDMLKPIDKNVEISDIKLESKTGGKSDFNKNDHTGIKCAVIVCSDRISKGEKQDVSGKTIIEKMETFGITTNEYKIIPDDFDQIQTIVKSLADKKFELVIFTGGTGLSSRDVTPDAISPLIEKEIPGIMEHARNYGQQRMPYAMLSRSVAGFIKNTLVLTLPGSKKGAAQTIDALFPYILHLFELNDISVHDQKPQ
ncbi:MAG: bifunctional molybdenum cofactor biosynthesis protein MoaC/MoaB [Bacteroidota bacterium]|nr:bifunctional molybdenum cofactor biosynthesis protein MoaC/MoaB [Bacteroidota bacterium]